MLPIPQEVREIIVSARNRGESPEAIAVWTGVSRASVFNILSLYERTGSVEPKPFPGRQTALTREQMDSIRKAVEDEPDITLEELIERLSLPVKKSRLSTILIGMDFTFKKRRCIRKAKSGRTS